ncbi:MAG: outer membrane beta-barrel protein [Sphingorhabdus sp.]
MMRRFAFCTGTTVGMHMLFAGMVAPARAQGLPPEESLVRFSRHIAVRERVIPGYEAREVRLGSLILSPSVETAIRYSDNVLALDADRIADASLLLRPNMQLRTDWARRLVSLSASSAIERFADRPSENAETLDLSAYAFQEFGAGGRIRAIAGYRQGRESRESQNAFALTERPIRFRETRGALGASYRFARVQLSGEAGLTRTDFSDGRLPDGNALDQDYRDADTFRLRSRVEFAQSSALAYFAQATRDHVNYRDPAVQGSIRNSTTIELLGGVRFELPIAARGEIGIGYLRANYADPGFRDFSGLAVNANLALFPTQLTTVTLSAERSVRDSGISASRGYIATLAGVQVDHELLRSLILSASARFEGNSFNGIDRRDRRTEFGAGADYRLNRNFTLRARFDRLDLSSSGVERYKSFARNRFSLSLSARI